MQRLTWAKGKKKISSEKKYGMYNQCRPGFKLLQMKTLWQIKVSGWVELTCNTFCSKGEDISWTIIWKLLLQLLQFIAKKRYQIYQEKLSTFQTNQQPKILNFTGKKKNIWWAKSDWVNYFLSVHFENYAIHVLEPCRLPSPWCEKDFYKCINKW